MAKKLMASKAQEKKTITVKPSADSKTKQSYGKGKKRG